jgi:hypothetical protein
MPEFLAYRIMDNKYTYAQVPALWKPQVAQILTDLGRADLIIE